MILIKNISIIIITSGKGIPAGFQRGNIKRINYLSEKMKN